MAFLVESLTSDPAVFKNRMEAYYEYLESVRDRLPPDAFSFATAAWHYDFSDHRSPHDSWVESITVQEPSSGDRHQHRKLEITILLLAAYHDGSIKLVYKDVQSYNLTTAANSSTGMRNGHGDWLIDEIRLSENGLVLHEILFSTGVRWLIESADVTYHWEPVI